MTWQGTWKQFKQAVPVYRFSPIANITLIGKLVGNWYGLSKDDWRLRIVVRRLVDGSVRVRCHTYSPDWTFGESVDFVC